jgi:hypothetical protein
MGLAADSDPISEEDAMKKAKYLLLQPLVVASAVAGLIGIVAIVLILTQSRIPEILVLSLFAGVVLLTATIIRDTWRYFFSK